MKLNLKKLLGKTSVLIVFGGVLLAGGSAAAIFMAGFGGGATTSLQDGLVGHWKLDKNPSTWLDGFEDNTLDDWTVHDNDFEIKTNNVYEGTYSAGIEDSSAPTDVAEIIPENFESGQKPDTFSFYWYETTSSSGGGLRLFDDAGNLVAGFASDNDQWTLNDGDGWTYVKGSTGIYQVWTYVEFTFDWEAGTYEYYIERLSDGTTRSGTRNLASSNGVETLTASEHHGQAWGGHGAFYMWFDNIKFDYHSAKDSSPYDNHGIINGASPTVDRHGQVNNAYDFDGANDYIEGVNNDGLTDWPDGITVSVWIKSDTANWNDTGMLVSKRSSFILHPSSGSKTIRFYRSSGSSWNSVAYTSSADLTQWNHYVGTYDNSTLKLYENGELKNSKSVTGTIDSDTGNVFFGRDDGLSRYLDGQLDDIRIYDRALSSNDISKLYDLYNPGVQVASTQKNLAGHWKLDSNGNDATPHSNHGTVDGAISTTDRYNQNDSAYEFDGSDDYIDLSDDASPGKAKDLTVSVWAKAPSSGGGWMLGEGAFFRILMSPGGSSDWWIREEDFGSNNTVSGGSVSANTWHHFVGTYDSQTGVQRLFVDGVEVASESPNYAGLGANHDSFAIGRRYSTSNGFFEGQLDDVRIYRRNLSENEIRDLHDSYNPMVQVSDLQKNLKNNWSLNGDAKDKTPYAGHGTVNGATPVADRHGRTDSAYDFDGTDDYIALDNYFNSAGALPEFTVAAWVKVNAGEGGWSILDYDRSEYFTATISGNQTTTNKVGFHTTDSTSNRHDMSGNQDVADGTWHHVVWQYNGTDKVIYVDGAEDARVNNPYSGNPIGTGTTRYGFIGDGSEASSFNGNRNSLYYNGQVGNVRFYDRALSSTEIKTLFQIYH